MSERTKQGIHSQPAVWCWIYIGTEPGLWTVGFYDPKGGWVPESDHRDKEDAARRVHWLNGGEKE